MKKNNLIMYPFLIIIFVVFLFVPLKELLIRFNIISFYKTDNWEYVKKSNDKIYDKVMTLEAFIKNRYNNYFPMYNKINSAYYNAIISADKLVYNDIYLKDNIDNEHIFYNVKNNFFYVVNKFSKEELEERLDKEASFYNDIKNKYQDVELALYIPLRYEETAFKNIDGKNDLINNFLEKLDQNIKYKLFMPENLAEYNEYYYKTDHHYNASGALIAYKDILRMFNIENNDELNIIEVQKPYYGSMAKSTLLTKVSDTLTSINYKNKLKVNIDDENFKPLEKPVRNNEFYDYYVGYFNGMYDEIIYENETNYRRNLLIFGDSMSWQLDYLLATNFDKTYVINTKYGKWVNNNLYLDDYIKENKITHILFLREAKNLIFDADNFALDKKVIR